MNQLEDLLQQCTVKLSLLGRMGWGTGFFVAPGWILTCAHVVPAAEGQRVQVLWQKREFQAVVEQSLPDPYDVALLRVIEPLGIQMPCVYLDEEVRSRDPLYLFGYPDQDFPNGCPVTFSCEGLTGDEPAFIKFALGQVRPGMSGSALLNQRTGKVCGIVTFTRDRSTDLGGGAISVITILEKFSALTEQQQQFHQQDRRWRDFLESFQKVPAPLKGGIESLMPGSEVPLDAEQPSTLSSAQRRIFISYRSKEPDTQLASAFNKALQEAGHLPFMAGENIQWGEYWPARIDQELEQSDYLLLLLSDQSAISEMVIEEV
jgi:hypothetical protein